MICRIACCDDELKELQNLKKYFETLIIQTDLALQVDYYTSPLILWQKYGEEQEPYDILVLDMEMPEMTGMELASKIRKKQGRDVLILFLTSYPQYMQQSFQVQTFQYMVKPVSFTGFQNEILRAVQYIREDDNSIIFISTENEEVVIRIRNILCIEKEKGLAMMKINTSTGTVMAKGNFNKLGQSLTGKPFLRVSRACIVNMNHIYKFQGNNMILDNGRAVTMSQRKVTELKETFTKYIVLGGR